MMIDRVMPEETPLIDRRDYLCDCVWVEDRVRKGGTFRSSHLQTVYADLRHPKPTDYPVGIVLVGKSEPKK